MGEELLKTSEVFKTIIPWIKYHTERIDGKGYYGLSSEEIPLNFKIIAVADTYSAITTNRVYRSKKSYDVAVKILKEVSGTQLDEGIVDIFLKIEYSDLVKGRFRIKNDYYKHSKEINWKLNNV